MRSALWYLFTFGIPLVGFALCVGGGVVCYRWASARRIGRIAAALIYLAVTLLPIGLTLAAMSFGVHLARAHELRAFVGEDTWALLTFMAIYCGLATLANLALWLALALSARSAPPHRR